MILSFFLFKEDKCMEDNVIVPPHEEEYHKLEYDENNVFHIDEIPKTDFNMVYYEYNEKDVKRVERIIRSSFEYRSFVQFMKSHLDVNHCSFYEGYSMKNGLTIELHHSPFTLYNITEAVMTKAMHDKGCWETFKIAEEVVRLHYEFKIGLTPLNPTAHKLVHSQVLPVHPKIVLGDWKMFYKEYCAFLSEDANTNYKGALDLESGVKEVVVPKIMEYAPIKIESPLKALTSDFVDKVCIESKFKALENKNDKD